MKTRELDDLERTQTATVPQAAEPACYTASGVGVTLMAAHGPLEILRDVSFECRRGEIIGIVGRSGTGKTTLLRVLGGLLAPTVGTVELEGVPIDGPPDTVVTVFQDYGNALLPWRTVAKNVALPLERMSRAERDERVAEALGLVGLDGRGGDYPWRLSGGMQQRVQIARALALRPSVLLMDEPFGALDAMTKATMQDELLRVQEQTGATILFITHDIDEAVYLSDRVFVISGSPGKDGTPGTLPLQVRTELPRPREQLSTRESPQFLQVRHRLVEALAEHPAGAGGDR
jgi:NitT/TauT family transport system ATP-binding protein